MGVERFIYKPRIKNLVLVLLNGDYPSVNYDEDDDLRLYTLRCPLQYKSFIQSLLPTTVLLQYNTLTELSQLLNVLQNRHVIVSMDPKAVSEISTKSIITIQLVRYLCQKYHCDLISMKNFEASIAGVGEIIDLGFPIKPTYEDSHDNVLYIPKTWDNWSKIVLHGKSVALPEEELAGVIRNEETLQQLDESTDDTFLDDYLEKYTRQEKAKEPEITVPKTLHEFVQAVFE